MYRSDCSSLNSFSRTRQRCTCAISHANYSRRNGLEGERRAANLRARRDLITVDHCEKHHQPPKNNSDCIIELCSVMGAPKKRKRILNNARSYLTFFLNFFIIGFVQLVAFELCLFVDSRRRPRFLHVIVLCGCHGTDNLFQLFRHQLTSLSRAFTNFTPLFRFFAAAAAARVQTKQNLSCFRREFIEAARK